jgi:membrane-associated protease RseP (regulator of RpoE activity)
MVALLVAMNAATLSAQTVVSTDVNRAVLGFIIECYGCEAVGAEGERAFEYRSPPILISVAAGGPGEKAGLKPGDVLTHINGVSITTREGARLLSTVQPEKAVRLTVRRAGKTIEVNLTPQAAAYDMQAAAYDIAFDYSRKAIALDYSRKAIPLDTSRAAISLNKLPGQWYLPLQIQPKMKMQWQPRVANDSASAGSGAFTAGFAGLELTIDGGKPVKVTVLEPDCTLHIEVEGVRIQLRAPERCR